MSQSPQTGQFNSYGNGFLSGKAITTFVSIPSNGSIQFLHDRVNPDKSIRFGNVSIPSNGSIQFLHIFNQAYLVGFYIESQSPQTGQFNSYIRVKKKK